MSNIATFIDLLKKDQVLEAFQSIKDELSSRARTISEEVGVKVAQGFNMQPIVEAKDEKDEKEEDENLSDEEKEANKAKDEENKAKGE